MISHDDIRAAVISTLQADADINAVTNMWLRYLPAQCNMAYPAIYIGEIIQPFAGECGQDTQRTTLADPMTIDLGVLVDLANEATSEGTGELGTLSKLVYDRIRAVPTLGLPDYFRVHHISPVSTKSMPKCGKSIIRAKLKLNATWEGSQ